MFSGAYTLYPSKLFEATTPENSPPDYAVRWEKVMERQSSSNGHTTQGESYTGKLMSTPHKAGHTGPVIMIAPHKVGHTQAN